MSMFRRNLLSINGGGKLVDVTDRFERYANRRCSDIADVGDKFTLVTDTAWTTLAIPKEESLYADVSKYSPTSFWSTGLIKYVDENDVVVAWDANCTPDKNNQVEYGSYSRFKLNFPNGAVMAYVSSPSNNLAHINFSPKVYKKIM